jgi:hypothetical protein
MSARSRQAQRLARELAAQAGIPVQVDYDGTRAYLIQWGNGPTVDDISGLVTAELSSGKYADLPARILSCSRGYSARAFAARAASARREGTLDLAVQAGAAERKRLGVSRPSRARLSDEELAAHEHIEGLLNATAYPDRADDPADEPVIESLIELSGGNQYAMLPTLVSPPPADRGALPGPGERPADRCVLHNRQKAGATSGRARLAEIQSATGDAANALQQEPRELLGHGKPVTWTRAALRQALDREHEAWRANAIQDLEPGQ